MGLGNACGDGSPRRFNRGGASGSCSLLLLMAAICVHLFYQTTQGSKQEMAAAMSELQGQENDDSIDTLEEAHEAHTAVKAPDAGKDAPTQEEGSVRDGGSIKKNSA